MGLEVLAGVVMAHVMRPLVQLQQLRGPQILEAVVVAALKALTILVVMGDQVSLLLNTHSLPQMRILSLGGLLNGYLPQV
jgi:hypothetical protein